MTDALVGATGGIHGMKASIAAQWTALDTHFERHARLVDRFREAGREAVTRMWNTRPTNTAGVHRSLSLKRLLSGTASYSGLGPS